MRILAIALLVAGAAISPQAAQAASGSGAVAAANLSELKPAELRRLDFYVRKILTETAALARAEDAGDRHAMGVHDGELRSVARRYMDAAAKSGIDAERADAHFQSKLAMEYTGRVPHTLIGSEGLPSLRHLLEVAPEAVQKSTEPKGSYVDVIREVGKQTFGN